MYIYMYEYLCTHLEAQAPNCHQASEIWLKTSGEALNRRTNSKKVIAGIYHATGYFMATRVLWSIRNNVFWHTFGVWAPTQTAPEHRKCQQGVHTGSRGRPGIDFTRFVVAFWLQWKPPGDDFWCTCPYFSGISVTLSAILFQSSF